MRKRPPPLTEAEKKQRQRATQARWRKLHPNYAKEWHAENREYVKLMKRKYRKRKACEP